ncbi:MAG: hypothetical protein JST92_14385, partial [Deltaproteobacteria bacterium]|nr:hypothetical protein [Deltaproteobacteria bacterium]
MRLPQSNRRSSSVLVALSIALSAAAAHAQDPAKRREPTLREAQEAAARNTAGTREDDPAARARRSRWLPTLRGQFGGTQADKQRWGTWRGDPIVDDSTGTGNAWQVSASWDLSQLLFAKEEVAIALSSARIERERQQVRERCATLYTRRLTALRQARSAQAEERLSRWLDLLSVTSDL